MTKEIFAKGIGKAIPLVGGFISAGITLPTFTIMVNKLHKHFRNLNYNSQIFLD
ncbi:MAG: hypothetical protein RBQ97_04285 [Acholeplasma sp.]|nr:hypothetical protein [Acholeplasma sp.]